MSLVLIIQRDPKQFDPFFFSLQDHNDPLNEGFVPKIILKSRKLAEQQSCDSLVNSCIYYSASQDGARANSISCGLKSSMVFFWRNILTNFYIIGERFAPNIEQKPNNEGILELCRKRIWELGKIHAHEGQHYRRGWFWKGVTNPNLKGFKDKVFFID